MLAGASGGVAGRPGVRSVPAWISRDSAENAFVISLSPSLACRPSKCYSTYYEYTGTIYPTRPDRQGDIGQRGGGRPQRPADSRGPPAPGPRAGGPAGRQPHHGGGGLQRPAPPGP